MGNKQLLINPPMIEDKVRGIKDAIEDIRQELYIRNKLLGKAAQLLKVCEYISGVLDHTLDLNDPKDKKIATAKVMIEEFTRSFWLTCSENCVDESQLVDTSFNVSELWDQVESRLINVNGKIMFDGRQPNDSGKVAIEDQLEKFLLKTMGREDWPTEGNPFHWHINIKDEDWFNELAHLSEDKKFSEEKGDFTEINFVPSNYINIAGWRGNVMFTVPLYPKEEKPVYTLKEGIKKISEFIIAGKIEIPGFKYN